MTPIICYLKEGQLLEDKTEARKIQFRATRFIIIDDVLYRRGHSLPYLRCANMKETNYVLREIHEGVCGNQRHLEQATIGQHYKRMHMTSLRHAISANTLQISKHDQVN